MSACKTCQRYAAAMAVLIVVLAALAVLSAVYPNATFP
jgi:hypothetical protein